MEAKKIDKHVYHDMYLRHVFKKKSVVMESIHKNKEENAIEKTLSDQSKNKASRGRKHAGWEERALSGIGSETARVLAMLGVCVVMGVWNIAADWVVWQDPQILTFSMILRTTGYFN
ncbi:hypothetical protein C5167_030899 [Papaver somniferum]|nr:hypothetical protein C5167_030899 [Papaver somniferum]